MGDITPTYIHEAHAYEVGSGTTLNNGNNSGKGMIDQKGFNPDDDDDDAEYSRNLSSGKSLHDDSDLNNNAHGEADRGLQRNLKARHLTMISLGGTIGTGLFLASGSSIATAGPGFSQVAYTLIGTMVFCFMSSLGEMATYLPITGSINAYGGRFFDPALAFML
ncbi:hypothetical protein BGW38_001380, partial [Lunasporangiospora selenospora]